MINSIKSLDNKMNKLLCAGNGLPAFTLSCTSNNGANDSFCVTLHFPKSSHSRNLELVS